MNSFCAFLRRTKSEPSVSNPLNTSPKSTSNRRSASRFRFTPQANSWFIERAKRIGDLMGSRGKKRSENGDVPIDKRACSSDRRDSPGLENASQSEVAADSVIVSTAVTESSDGMDISHAAGDSVYVSTEVSEFSDGMDIGQPGTSNSEGEHEQNSVYGSSDSEGISAYEDNLVERNLMAAYGRRKSSNQLVELSKLISNLGNKDTDEYGQLAALTNLCEQLSFLNGYSLTPEIVESVSPILVSLAKHETNPNIMLLAIRAVTYTCDVFPQAAGFFVKHGAIPALCQKLVAIEYLDLAEQCLQALEKISRDQPLACLQSEVIMAALTYLDFFSACIQRVALSIIMNICTKLPAKFPSSLMEALPILCNVLQYEDQQVVERVATCLIKISAQVSISSKFLQEICNHGVVNQIVSIIDMNNRSTRTALSQSVYTGLIGLLSKLASCSLKALKTLYELNISAVLRDILLSYYPSSGLSFINFGQELYNQIQEVLKLLNELLPTVDDGQHAHTIVSDKKSFLAAHPDIQQKLGTDVLPCMIQVFNMGADMQICYGCLSFINKLVYFSTPEVLLELLLDLNISSFLAGVFTRKDPHILILALKISETILQKQYDNFMNSFVKDGVFFAIEGLLGIELSSQFTYPMIDGSPVSIEPGQKAAQKKVCRCLCYALCTGMPSKSSPCNLRQESVNDLAKQIKLNFFPKESGDSNNGVTEIHRELKALSSKLTELLAAFDLGGDADYPELDEEIQRILSLILNKLNGTEPVSTFEFIESGVIQALLTFLSCGMHISREANYELIMSCLHIVDNRFKIFARKSMFLRDNHSRDMSFLVLVQKLQSALTTVENFPVILGQPFKLRSSFSLVPDKRVTMYPTFKVQFLRGEGGKNLSVYSSNCVTVDPFSSLKAIEKHLWAKVSTGKKESIISPTEADIEMKYAPAVDGVIEGNIIDHMETGSRNAVALPSNDNEISPNLSLYLGDQKLDLDHTLYQAILQQQWKPEYDLVTSANFWTRIYTVTYTSASSCGENYMDQGSPMADELHTPSWLSASTILMMFRSKIPSDLDQMSSARDILYLIKILECMNRNMPSLLFQERSAFADDNMEKMNSLALTDISVPQKEFVSSRLTEKLEQQMQDHAAINVGGLPSWWNQLVTACPFLFAFDTRCKYFRLSVIGPLLNIAHGNSRFSGLAREKFLAIRDNVLESASKMMELHTHYKANLEVEFGDEVGTGLGPTLEFYTLVSHEFQRSGMGMWREDSLMQHPKEVGEFVVSRFGLFPCPWYCPEDGSEGTLFSEVIQKFALLGQIVAKALHDGRVLDLHLSKAFYKIILGKDLDLYDIQLFDPELARALQKFKEISQNSLVPAAEIEDLILDFTLPGYPDYLLHTEKYNEMVTKDTLNEYVSLVVDATLNTGIYRQVEAFEAGFNQVFPIEHTYIFNEEELERLLCGEQNLLADPNELLTCVTFDHGYTASSPPILNLLEILQDLDHDQQRAFVQFVTGTPRLPPGGLASLNPRLTIVRKHSDNYVDDELPSAMTCAHYLKLPPYSSKSIMKEKLLYAISEGQGSFHLS